MLDATVSNQYIAKIAEALWNHRAAVMVGTGLSRDAERISEDVAPVPLWGSLAKKMREQLSYSEKNSVDVLPLASQYEAQYGRQELERFLRNQIPDEQYLPGEAHKTLVSLPWTNIFTTNYDTLLERTDKDYNGSSYDVVQTSIDIAMSHTSRRIVKLHGSFPLAGSIIFTEEDYRTYPALHAPFVNMVQQSMMENVFCLLGFSGTDPNFLRWLGWVRDNLGCNMPKVYLCGIFHMPKAQRMDFERKNVAIVDLDCLAENLEHPDEDERQKDAMVNFLQRLKQAKPPSDMDWGSRKEETSNESLVALWKREREAYPGWVIAPYQIRRRMEADYSGRLTDQIEKLDIESPAKQLAFAYEFNWRMERMLGELDEGDVRAIIGILKSIYPFSSLPDKHLHAVDIPVYDGEDLPYLKKAWVELAFAVLRWMRVHDREQMYPELKGLLEDRCRISKKWMSCLRHENCLRALERYDRESVLEELKAWKKNRIKPFDDFWIAALYACIDELEEAEHLAMDALFEIRRRLHGNRKRSTRLNSLRNWGMYLLHAIRPDRFSGDEGFHWDENTEWEEREFLPGDPQQEIDFLAGRVMARDSDVRIAQIAYCSVPPSSFEPGKTAEKLSNVSNEFGIPIFSWYKLHEAAPLPVRGRLRWIHSKADSEAFRVFWQEHSSYSLPWLLRMASPEDFEALLGRWQVACLSQKDVHSLFALSMQGLQDAIQYLGRHPDIADSLGNRAIQRTMERMMELLSRLCFRINEEDRDNAFLLAVHCYNENACRSNSSLWNCLWYLWKRLVYAMLPQERRKHLADMLRLPVLGESGFDMGGSRTMSWPEPFDFIDPSTLAGNDSTACGENLKNQIKRLLLLVGDRDSEVRRRALRRMIVLYKAAILDADQIRSLGKAIWKQKAYNHLPDCVGFHWADCLSWPGAAEECASERLRSFLKNGDFESTRPDENGEDVHCGIKEYECEWRLASKGVLVDGDAGESNHRIEWTQEELHAFIVKAIRHMRVLLDGIPEINTLPEKKRKREELASVIKTLALSVFPFLDDLRDAEWNSLQALLEKMEEKRISRVLLRVSVSLHRKDVQDAERIIQAGLVSALEWDVAESFDAIRLLMSMQHGTDKDMSQALLGRAVRGIFLLRSIRQLSTVLNQTADLLHRFPNSFTDAMLDDLCQVAIRLHEETQSEAGKSMPPTGQLGQDAEELPEILSATAHLVKSMHEWYCQEAKADPEIVEMWRKKCMKSVLPEVRSWAWGA